MSVDRCIMRRHRNAYLLKVIPEATKQGTATALVQDLLLIAQPWSFNVTSIPDVLQPAMHFWHGTGDLQVGVSDGSQAFSSTLLTKVVYMIASIVIQSYTCVCLRMNLPEAIVGQAHWKKISCVRFYANEEIAQVDSSHSENYKRLFPKASLKIIENGGHMAYWACDKAHQQEAFQQLLTSGLPA